MQLPEIYIYIFLFIIVAVIEIAINCDFEIISTVVVIRNYGLSIEYIQWRSEEQKLKSTTRREKIQFTPVLV